MSNLLQERIEKYQIPAPPFQPVFNYIVVFRIPSETKSAGGLIIPDNAQRSFPYGILVAWGMKAHDELGGNGVQLGDVVWFAKYSGWDEEVSRDPLNHGKKLTFLEAKEIRGSEDLRDRLAAGEMEESQGPDGRWALKIVTKKRKAA